MSKVALVDFGASRIKSVLVDLASDSIIASSSKVSPSSEHQIVNGKFEVPAIKY